jgi:hypothetical protein
MKIKELLKYSAFPINIILILIGMYFINSISDEGTVEYIIWMLIFFFVFVGLMVVTYFTLFKFFKKKENGFFYVISICLLLILVPIQSLGNSAEFPALLLFFTTPGYIIMTILFSIKVKENRHLLFFLIASGIILSFYFVANFLFIEDKIIMGKLMSISVALFLIISFALIFSLPGSNYLDWKKEHKHVFLKMVLAPWVVALSILLMNFIINPNINPDKKVFSRSNLWNMVDYEISPGEGQE